VKGKPDFIDIIEEKNTIMWPLQENARGESAEINFGISTRGEAKKRT
jgi:hypothetical protein